jgi:hypothetical protein
VCSNGESTMSGSDAIDYSTHVRAVRCMSVPAALSCHARHSISLSFMDHAPIASLDTESP